MQLISIQETSNLIGLSVNTLYQYVSRNKIPHVKIGSRTLFDTDDLVKWIAERKVRTFENVLEGSNE